MKAEIKHLQMRLLNLDLGLESQHLKLVLQRVSQDSGLLVYFYNNTLCALAVKVNDIILLYLSAFYLPHFLF